MVTADQATLQVWGGVAGRQCGRIVSGGAGQCLDECEPAECPGGQEGRNQCIYVLCFFDVLSSAAFYEGKFCQLKILQFKKFLFFLVSFLFLLFQLSVSSLNETSQ